MIWNVIGSMAFVGAQWMMTILIVRLSGYRDAGWLSLGLSLTNVSTNIVYFGVRNFQVSDSTERYTSCVYVAQRFLMAAIALIVYGIFVIINRYPVDLGLFLILFMVYRMAEPLADVFHGVDQRHWRLDIAGISFLLRGFLGITAFILVEQLVGNLIITTIVMIAAVYPVIVLFDFPRAARLGGFDLRKVIGAIRDLSGDFFKSDILSLTKECFPLFIYAICLNSVVPVPRYYLEKINGSEILGYYTSAAIPASIVQMLASYVYTTFTGLFSQYAKEGSIKAFRKLMAKLCLGIGILSLSAIIFCMIPARVLPEPLLSLVSINEAPLKGDMLSQVGVFGAIAHGMEGFIPGSEALQQSVKGAQLCLNIGEWALCLLFTESILGYAELLIPTIASCFVIALVWFFGMLLTVLRDKKGLIAGAVTGTGLVIPFSVYFINRFGVWGVNPAVAAASFISLAVFFVRVDQKLKE